MEASTWQYYGYLLDDTSKANGRDCTASRRTSKVTCEDYTLLDKNQLSQEGLGHRMERGNLPDPECDLHVSTKLQMSRSLCERGQRGLVAEELCLEEHAVSKARRRNEGEVSPKVYEIQVGQRRPGTSRTVKPVVYRLEESEYRRLIQEGETECEGKWEMTEYKIPLIQKNLSHQEGYPGNEKAASPNVNTINTFQGTLRKQISRSDSESSVENRQVNKLTLNSPSEENKPRVPIRLDSFERNAMLMDYILQSKQETTTSVSHIPRESSKAAESFRQTVNFTPQTDDSPDLCRNGQTSEEDPVRKPEKDKQVVKSLEIMVSAAANCASVARNTEKLSRQNSSQLLESWEKLGGEADAGIFDLYSQKNTPPAPPARSHSKESLALSISKTMAMTEVLLEQCSDAAKLAKKQTAAAAERSADQLTGGRIPGGGGPEEQERKGWKNQEDEKVLKVADAKKTFEKHKPPEGKAATPPPSTARKASLVQLDPRQQGEKQNKMTKGFKTG
nr:PREDICTED: coronin-1C isoform X1 [Apteryx mantelli mantelli]